MVGAAVAAVVAGLEVMGAVGGATGADELTTYGK